MSFSKQKAVEFCVSFTCWVAIMILLGALNFIDFHVCIKNAGHCKIIDPTTHKAVPL